MGIIVRLRSEGRQLLGFGSCGNEAVQSVLRSAEGQLGSRIVDELQAELERQVCGWPEHAICVEFEMSDLAVQMHWT